MPVLDPDAWRLAVALQKRLGDQAFEKAVERAQTASDARDMASYAVWVDIAKALQELHRPRRSTDPVN